MCVPVLEILLRAPKLGVRNEYEDGQGVYRHGQCMLANVSHEQPWDIRTREWEYARQSTSSGATSPLFGIFVASVWFSACHSTMSALDWRNRGNHQLCRTKN